MASCHNGFAARASILTLGCASRPLRRQVVAAGDHEAIARAMDRSRRAPKRSGAVAITRSDAAAASEAADRSCGVAGPYSGGGWRWSPRPVVGVAGGLVLFRA